MAKMIDCLLLLSIAVVNVASEKTDLESVPRAGTPVHSSVSQYRRALTQDTCVQDDSLGACEPCTASYQCKDTFCCPYMKLCGAGPCGGPKWGDCSPNCHSQGEPGYAEVQKCKCNDDFPLNWMTCDDGSMVGPAGVEDPNFEPPPPVFGPGCADDCAHSSLIDNGKCEDGGHRSTWDACALGSDCTDCGAREMPPDTGCADDCFWSQLIGNGKCEDGGPGSEWDHCDLGSDCTDCGTRGIETPDSAAVVCSFAVVWFEHNGGAKGELFSSLELADAKYDELFNGAFATRMYDQSGGIEAEHGNIVPKQWTLLDDWRLSNACCEDDSLFRDALDYPCVDWVSYDCFDTTPYTSDDLKDVRLSCPDSCGLCLAVSGHPGRTSGGSTSGDSDSNNGNSASDSEGDDSSGGTSGGGTSSGRQSNDAKSVSGSEGDGSNEMILVVVCVCVATFALFVIAASAFVMFRKQTAIVTQDSSPGKNNVETNAAGGDSTHSAVTAAKEAKFGSAEIESEGNTVKTMSL